MDDLNTISLIAWLALFATLGTLLMVWWAMSAMATLFVCSAPSFDEPKESGTAALTRPLSCTPASQRRALSQG